MAIIQADDENREDIAKTQEKHKTDLENQHANSKRLRHDILAMTKDNQKLIDCNNDLENIKEEIKEDNNRLEQDKEQFNIRKKGLNKQLDLKEDTIMAKEDALLQLRNTNLGLQDFREVCNHIV